MGMVVPRGETSETPDPVLQRGPPDAIPRRGGVCKEHFLLCGIKNGHLSTKIGKQVQGGVGA